MLEIIFYLTILIIFLILVFVFLKEKIDQKGKIPFDLKDI